MSITFITKVTEIDGNQFKRYCDMKNLSPYSILKQHIVALIKDLPPEDSNLLDFSNIALAVFPTIESALLALDVSQAKCHDELPDWFHSLIEDKCRSHFSWDPKELVKRLQKNMKLLRLLIIEETTNCAIEQDLKLKEHPIAPIDLSEQQVDMPRVTLSNEDAERWFDEFLRSET